MSLPRQLLLLSLILGVLPLGGWQVAVQVESSLRQAREEALLATAAGLARVWELDGATRLAESGVGLPVHRIHYPIVTDGYTDDWSAWLPYARRSESPDQRAAIEWLLCRDDRHLYALVRVRDGSPPRASVSPSGFAGGDHLAVALEGPRGQRQVRLTPSVPGTLDIMGAGDGDESAVPLSGAWREDADGGGYTVEFSLPIAAVQRFGLMAVDANEPWPGAGPVHLGTLDDDGRLARFDLSETVPEWNQRLQGLAPEGSRLWLLDGAGRVMAQGGRLAPSSENRQRRWWHALVYRLLARQVLEASEVRDPAVDLALDGSEIRRAVSGHPAVRWQAGDGEFSMQASAAVPIHSQGRTVGALVLEQAGDALLLVANRTVAGTVLGSLLAVLLVVAILFTFASIHSLRIRRLRDAVEAALDRDGQAGMALPASRARDEIGDLSRSFEALLRELGEYNDYLRSLAGRLSHELNTPLAVVRSSLDNLAHEDLPDSAAAYAERARDGAERLQAILRAMSEANRLEQALHQQEGEDFDLADVVRGCFESYRGVAPDFDWQLDLKGAACPLHGSPELVAQLLDKLVDNARSFTPSGGLIRIRLESHPRGPILRVANDGPVLPDNLRGRLFQSLVSLRRPGGQGVHLGLGLHVVRLIAHAHGGAVAARNRPDDQGVEFIVRLRGLPPPT